MNILVTQPMGVISDTFFPDDVINRIECLGSTEWNDSKDQFSIQELNSRLKTADICISGWGCARFSGEVLEGADRLRLVAHTGGSVAPVVSEELYEKGVRVISGNLVYAESVAESVIAYALMSLRRLPFFMNEIQDGRWKSIDYFNEGLIEQKVGLVGFGMVAKCLVKLLEPFRTKVSVYDPYLSDETAESYGVHKASLEQIITGSKIISLHAAQTPETYHLINRELIEKIPDGIHLINTSRGSVIDEDALADELKKGRFNAILDVFDYEPLPSDSKLRGMPNALLVPHMGGPTIDRRKATTEALLDDIVNFLSGRPLKYEITLDYALRMTR